MGMWFRGIHGGSGSQGEGRMDEDGEVGIVGWILCWADRLVEQVNDCDS